MEKQFTPRALASISLRSEETGCFLPVDYERLDYEINENDLFKHDWRSRSKVLVLHYIFLKWTLAFLVGLLTRLIATLINVAVENIAGYKLLAVINYIDKENIVE
ncbi:chloride channel CLC-b-like [Olea europaea subsp. europaea]|uniref:Chloride channel CLC-b-like n=1 Tax=Olea europaea subsp. europaea TaxID=158383 RepID=A0A8S0TKX0_OLEEU|nr:chloride channel CLC-b-like [Olea europaea subsp. europaea]